MAHERFEALDGDAEEIRGMLAAFMRNLSSRVR